MSRSAVPAPLCCARFPCGYKMKRADTQSTTLPDRAGALSARLWHQWAPKLKAAGELSARWFAQSIPPPHTGDLAACVLTSNLPPALPPFAGAQLASATTTTLCFSPLPKPKRVCWRVQRRRVWLAGPTLVPGAVQAPGTAATMALLTQSIRQRQLGYGFKLRREK